MKGALPRFTAVDGMRAWMAWLVVISHITNQAGLSASGPLWSALHEAGIWGVRTFIVISGFVITHLLLERRESYLPFIVRRFMRLYPVFLFCAVLGFFVYEFAAAFGRVDWFNAIHGAQYAAQMHWLPQQIVAHLTMLHGAIPNDVLPRSEYAFDPPAWSVSLEWQFYLIAPAVIAFIDRKRPWLLVVGLVALACLVDRFWLRDHWAQPSFLLSNLQWFAGGIASRFAVPAMVKSVRYPVSIGLAAILTFGAFREPSPGFWIATFVFLLADRDALVGFERHAFLVMRWLLESGPIQYLGARSYSTYLLHWPIMLAIGAVVTHYTNAQGFSLAAALLLTIPAVLILQELTYKYIEVPGQALGKYLARRLGQPVVVEVPVEVA